MEHHLGLRLFESGPKRGKIADVRLVVTREDALDAGMRVLSKSHPKTWSNGPSTKTSDLDHVIASNDLTFEILGSTSEGDYEIEVDGWNNELEGNERTDWIKNISDHCALVGKTL